MIQSNIETIKDMIDIVDIARDIGVLKKQGRNYVMLCPFHDERSPSLTIFPRTQSYKCFSCTTDKGQGSAIDLYARSKNITFSKAVHELEKELGLVNHYLEQSEEEIKSSFDGTGLPKGVFKLLGLSTKEMRMLFEKDKEKYFDILEEKLVLEKDRREGKYQMAIEMGNSPRDLTQIEKEIKDVNNWLEVGVYAELDKLAK